MGAVLILLLALIAEVVCLPDVPVDFCFNISRRKIDGLVSVNSSVQPWQVITSKRLVNCLADCNEHPHCFVTAYDTNSRTCSMYKSTLDQLGAVTEKYETTSPRVIASLPDTPENYSATGCLEKCGSLPCRKDCGYDGGSEYMCIADHTSCKDSQYNSFKYYFLGTGVVSGGDNFTAKTVNFEKKSSSSTLRLSLRGELRTPGTGCTNCCRKYSLFIDGAPCSNPAPIESMMFVGTPTNNGHRSDGIDGLCDGISAGNHAISLVFQSCGSDYVSGVGAFGHRANNWLYIQEIYTSNETGKCPGYVSENIKQFLTRDYINSSSSYQFGQEIRYWKKNDDTAIKILFHGAVQTFGNPDYNASATSIGSQFRCVRWFYKFNGLECSSPMSASMINDQRENNNYKGSERRYHIWDAICYGIPAGQVLITLHSGNCLHGVPYGASEMGWPSSNENGVTRFIVEEIQLSTKYSAAMDLRNGKEVFTRLPFFNVLHVSKYWTGSQTSNPLWSWTYQKISQNSALRFMLNGNGKTSKTDNLSYYCCAWYFLINDAQCSNPGSINGIIEDKHTASISNPKQFTIDGVCVGLPSGVLDIKLNFGACLGLTIASSCNIGFMAPVNVFIMEISL